MRNSNLFILSHLKGNNTSKTKWLNLSTLNKMVFFHVCTVWNFNVKKIQLILNMIYTNIIYNMIQKIVIFWNTLSVLADAILWIPIIIIIIKKLLPKNPELRPLNMIYQMFNSLIEDQRIIFNAKLNWM